MTQKIINVGSDINTRDGDLARVAFQKINDNFSEVYNGIDYLNTNANMSGSYIGSTVTDIPDQNNNNPGIAIDLSKQIHKLTTGHYYVPDGYEGQILYFVPASGATINYGVYVRFEHVRFWRATTNLDIGSYSRGWAAFRNNGQCSGTIATCIFTDGAWNIGDSFMLD